MSAERDTTLIAESHLELERAIRQRAHEIYLRRGSVKGDEFEDWLQAEREVLASRPERAQDNATVVGSAKTPRRRR